MATTPASGAVAAPIHTDALAALATPCLIVDVAALTRNLRRAANHVAGTRVKLRPHFKAHKCTALLRRQLEAGGCSGVTCATAAEALVLAEADFDDILVANQIVDRHALATLAAAAGRAHVTVAVDSHVHVGLLQRLAAKEGVDLDVLIEVDVGLHRGGLPPRSADLLSLAVAVAHAPGLSFAGLQGYEGHAVFVADRAKRRRLVNAAANVLEHERDRLAAAGFPCRLISGGGTGTFELAIEAGVHDEVQAGSYPLMDVRYLTLHLMFEPALYCLASVISRRDDRAVLDCGLKSLSAEYGLPKATTPQIECLDLSDEHTQVRLHGVNLAVGDRVTLIPGHVDPTVNLHDTLFVVDDDEVQPWAVDGRRRYIGDQTRVAEGGK